MAGNSKFFCWIGNNARFLFRCLPCQYSQYHICFREIGYFILVIEAMIAAPLVAMAIAHPEGHDILGKAEASVLLFLSIFSDHLEWCLTIFSISYCARVFNA